MNFCVTAMGIALCLLTACSKTYSPLSPEGPVEVGFYAGGDGSTRSTMNGDGLSASWSEGDRMGQELLFFLHPGKTIFRNIRF